MLHCRRRLVTVYEKLDSATAPLVSKFSEKTHKKNPSWTKIQNRSALLQDVYQFVLRGTLIQNSITLNCCETSFEYSV